MEASKEFRIGPFNTGDLIALGTGVFFAGTLWWRVATLERDYAQAIAERDKMSARVQTIEQLMPNNYVRREDYREDMRELKALMLRIEQKIDEPHP